MNISFDDVVKSIRGFSGITDDSRKVRKNYIFVAIKGLNADGHGFIDGAVKSGAKIVIGQEDLDIFGADYIKVPDARKALGELASAFYGKPSEKLKVIGVTGTKGKTSTCHIIYHILTSLGRKTGLVSSISAKIGDKEIDTGFHVTSPGVVSLHKFLRQMVDAGCEYAVVEVSSHGIDQKRIAGVDFEVAVLTNIAPEHLDYHKSFKEYKSTKMGFVSSAKHKVMAPEETEINILPGKFNNLNVYCAVEAVSYFGINKKTALKTLESYKLPEGRLEEINTGQNFKVFVDFAHTPESLEAVLSYLKTITDGKLISVFGAAGERDAFKRPKMGLAASKYSDVIILTSEDPRSEKAEKIIGQIKQGVKPEAEVYEIPDRKGAIQFAIDIAKEGDVVGIFGKGHEKSMNLDGMHEIPWSDQKIVREYVSK